MPVDHKCPACNAPLRMQGDTHVCPACLFEVALLDTRDAEAQHGRPAKELLCEEIPGRYTGATHFASGGMGTILLVHDTFMERTVALKELHADRQGNPESEWRFLREARVTAQLEHQNIVAVHEVGLRASGTPYYTMRRIQGEPLSRAIAQCATLEDRLALLPRFVDVCHAIAYAHSRGVIHRDIKPANIMVGAYGETVVIDWGIARMRGESAETSPHQADGAPGEVPVYLSDAAAYPATADGVALGTPEYMGPEQALGRHSEVDELTDVYALGAMLYHLLTARAPFSGTDQALLLKQLITTNPAPVLAQAPGVPPELAAICEKAMAKNKSDRYPSSMALAEEIQRFQSGALVNAHQYDLSQHLKRFYRRHRPLVSAVAIALVCLISGGAYYNRELYHSRERERARLAEVQAANEVLRKESYVSTLLASQQSLDTSLGSRALEILENSPEELRGWEWHHMHRVAKPYLFELEVLPEIGLAGFGLGLAISDDDRYVLDMWQFGHAFSIFDRHAGARIYTHPKNAFAGWPYGVQFTSSPNSLFIAKDWQTLVHFDFAQGKVSHTLRVDSGMIWSYDLSPDGKTAAGYVYNQEDGSRQIHIWDFATGAVRGVYPLNPLLNSPYDRIAPHDLHWRLYALGPRGKLGGFLADNRTLVFSDTHLATLDVETGEIHRYAETAYGSVAADQDAGLMAVVRPDSEVELWNAITGKSLGILAGGPFRDAGIVTFGHQGRQVGLTFARNLFAIWNTENRQKIVEYTGGNESVNALVIARNEPLAIGLGNRHGARFWDTGSGNVRSSAAFTTAEGVQLEQKPGRFLLPYFAYDISNNHQLFVWSVTEGELTTFSLPGFVLRHRIKAHAGRINDIVISPSGRQAATAGWDGYARVWDLFSGTLIREFPPETEEACYTVAFNPTESLLAVGYGERSTEAKAQQHPRLYSLSSGQVEQIIERVPRRTNKLIFSPDGRYLFLGDWSPEGSKLPTFYILDGTQEYARVGQIDGLGWGDEIAFHPDGRHLLALGDGEVPVLFDLETMREVYRLKDLGVATVAFHPDGTRFTTSAYRQDYVHVHDFTSGRVLLTLKGVQGPSFWSGDGETLFARDPDAAMVRFQGSPRNPGQY